VKPTAAELKQFGQGLYGLLVRGDIEKIYGNLPPRSHVRLKIFSNRADLQAIPWEYMQEPDCLPGPNSLRSIVRVVSTIGLPAPVPKKLGQRVRMLFAYAEPALEPSIDWPAIKTEIETRFNRARMPDRLVLDVVEGATRDSFMRAFRGKDYDILHMVCHGQIINDVGYLLFQDVKGNNSEPVSASDLAMLLRDKNLALVVLSACETATGDFSKEFATVAKTLVEEAGIPAVVANQYKIEIGAAAAFAGEFYAELLTSGDVDRATTKGRAALIFGKKEASENTARIDWGIPTLYRHVGGARIFEP
jgi:hypothetical protein